MFHCRAGALLAHGEEGLLLFASLVIGIAVSERSIPHQVESQWYQLSIQHSMH